MFRKGPMVLYENQNNQAAEAVEIELLLSSEQIAAASRWQSLEKSVKDTGLTNSWPWIKAWIDHYGDIVQPIYAFGKQNNQTIGAALITKPMWRKSEFAIPSLHLGTAGEPRYETCVEYNRLLVAPENLVAFAVGLMRTLQQRFRWSALRLDGFVPEHAHALLRASASAGLQFRVDERKCPVFNFQRAGGEGYQDVISALGQHTRYNIRRSLRLFDTNFGRRSIEWAKTPEQAKDILRELIHLHQKRWESVGNPGALKSDRVRRYHEELIDTLSLWPQGSLIVFRLKQGETTIGCLFNLVDGDGRVMAKISGLPQFEDRKLKPGLVTHAICMEECKRRGLFLEEEQPTRQSGLAKEACRNRRLLNYDFLAGEALYKEQLSNMESSLTWATVRQGPCMWLFDKAQPPFQLIRKFMRGKVQASKPLWKAAVHAKVWLRKRGW